MDISISIPDELVAKLEKKAAERQQSISTYSSHVVADAVTKPSLDEIMAPVRADFAESGMSEEEINDLLRGELEAHRREKREQKAKSA
jgi:hypothetical protein